MLYFAIWVTLVSLVLHIVLCKPNCAKKQCSDELLCLSLSLLLRLSLSLCLSVCHSRWWVGAWVGGWGVAPVLWDTYFSDFPRCTLQSGWNGSVLSVSVRCQVYTGRQEEKNFVFLRPINDGDYIRATLTGSVNEFDETNPNTVGRVRKNACFNPFTAPAYEICRLKSAYIHTCLRTVYLIVLQQICFE